MKVAIIGSRNLNITNIGDYLPENVTEIISGGAKGVDSCAKEYALKNNIPFTEFLPDYRRFGRGAPLKRNLLIIEYADMVIAFWNGVSKGTKYVIDNCQKVNIPVKIIKIS